MPQRWDLDDLAATGDVAARLGVKNSTVSNWMVRYPNFPAPLVTLSTGPVHSMRQVVAWYDQWTASGRADAPRGYVTGAEAARLIDVSPATIVRWRDAGQLAVTEDGLYLAADVQKMAKTLGPRRRPRT